MKRRKFLGTVGTAAAVGIAGCAGGQPCGELGGEGAAKTAFISMEAPFVRTDEGGLLEDNTASSEQILDVEAALQPCQSVEQTKVGHHEADGPYGGYIVREGIGLETVKQAFKDAGINIDNDWWAYQTPSNWGQTGETLTARLETARGFTTNEELADFTIETTGRDEKGKQAGVVFDGRPSDKRVKNTIYALTASGGFALSPIGSGFDTQSVQYVAPEAVNDGYIETVDVAPRGDAYEVRVSLGEQFRLFASDQPDALEAVAVRAPGSTVPAIDVEDGVPDDPVATAVLQDWTAAFATATALAHPLDNPVYADFDSLSECGSTSTAAE